MVEVDQPIPMHQPMFTPDERTIFKYFDGVKDKWADPTAIRRRIYQNQPDFDAVLRAYNRQFYDEQGKNRYFNDDKTPRTHADPPPPAILQMALASEEKVIAAARFAFGLPAIDPETGAGVRDDVAIKALLAWTEFEEKNVGTGKS